LQDARGRRRRAHQPRLLWLGVERASLDQADSLFARFQLLFLQRAWQIKPKSPWSIGLRYIYAQVEPKLRDEPVFPGGPIAPTSTSRHLPASSSSTVATTFSRRRAESFAETVFLLSREDLGASVISSGFSRS
jgi:hypothetical protein